MLPVQELKFQNLIKKRRDPRYAEELSEGNLSDINEKSDHDKKDENI